MVHAFHAPRCLLPSLLADDLWRRTDLHVVRAQPHTTSGAVRVPLKIIMFFATTGITTFLTLPE